MADPDGQNPNFRSRSRRKPPRIETDGSRTADAPGADANTSSRAKRTSGASKKKRSAAARPKQSAVEQISPIEDSDDTRRFSVRRRLRGSAAFLVSMVTHAIVLLVLGVWVLPGALESMMPSLVVDATPEPDEPLSTVELDQQSEPGTAMVFAGPAAGAASDAPAEVSEPVLDPQVLEADEVGTEIRIDGTLPAAPGRGEMFKELPRGALGQGRAIADSYAHAMDRITQEILWMLEKQDVLVVWCFDQSESMKDDQKEIRDRIERVYTELGMTHKVSGDRLLTAVTSFGKRFDVHTRKPTSELSKIRAAIDAVPVDDSGVEMMCSAVGRSINMYRKFVGQGRRRMALILVSDESGDRQDNLQSLEKAIVEAKSARCKIFVLGREAVFGYPYAYIRWKHPQTLRTHWLQIDRGPESAFVEQTQTDGFRRRYDAFPSGFGPYEQSRLAQQTAGIFFLLPSLEAKLVRGEKRRYELEATSAYHPDLRARGEILNDRDNSKFRMTLFKVIWDLNPHNKESAKVIELRVRFSPKPDTFAKQVGTELGKVPVYLRYLAEAEKVLEGLKRLRDEERKPRWQANYDLMYAQIVGYQARVYEYQAYLQAFMKSPKVVPLKRPPNLTLTYWDLRTRSKTITGEVIEPYVKRASKLFDFVVKEHPGTPWAARAQWELHRGYGVDLAPVYEPPYPKVSNPIPIPKL